MRNEERHLSELVPHGRLSALLLTVGSCMIASCTPTDGDEGGDGGHDARPPPSATECALDEAVAHLLQGNVPTDCGVLEPGTAAIDVVEANDCAREANASERAFRLTVVEQGIDSAISTTYVGTRMDGQYGVVALHFDSGWASSTVDTGSIGWSRCTAFEVADPCHVVDGGSITTPTNPCVSCQEQTLGACRCDDRGGISCAGFEPRP